MSVRWTMRLRLSKRISAITLFTLRRITWRLRFIAIFSTGRFMYPLPARWTGRIFPPARCLSWTIGSAGAKGRSASGRSRQPALKEKEPSRKMVKPSLYSARAPERTVLNFIFFSCRGGFLLIVPFDRVPENKFPVENIQYDLRIFVHFTGKYLLAQLIQDLFLHHTFHRPCPELRIVAELREPIDRLGRCAEADPVVRYHF